MATKTAGQRLRAWRLAKGLSQRAAARSLKCSQPAWVDWETDKKLPGIANALALEELTEGAVTVGMFARRSKSKGLTKKAA